MAGIKIVDLPAVGRDLAATDLFEMSLAGGTGSRKITGQEIMNASKLSVNNTPVINGTSGRIFFQGSTNVLQQSANLFFDQVNGRVGINTSLPASPLDVVGNGTIGFQLMSLRNTNASGWTEFNLLDNNGVVGGVFGWGNSSTVALTNSLYFKSFRSGSYAPILFTQDNGTAINYSMSISSQRNVLIGTTTDAGYKLDVNGTARVVNQLNSSNFLSTNQGTNNIEYFGSNNPNFIYKFSLRAVNNVFGLGAVQGMQGYTGGSTLGGYYFDDTGINYIASNKHTQIIGRGNNPNAINSGIYTFGKLNARNPGNTDTSGQLEINSILDNTSTTGVPLTFNSVLINPTLNTVATGSTFKIRGIYYNPTSVSIASFQHIAFESTTGDVLFGTTSGSVVVAASSVTNMQYGEVPKLYVNGGTFLNGTIQLGSNNIRVSGNNITWESTGIANNLPEWRADATGVKFGNYSSLPLRISVGGTENARFFSTGNVAIGITSDGGYKLDVNGSMRSTQFVQDASNANKFTGIINQGGASQQVVGINCTRVNAQTDLSVGFAGGADASAVIQANSTTKGFLPPRMTQTQRNAIASPAIGLEIYQTDATEGKYIYKSSGWTYIG